MSLGERSYDITVGCDILSLAHRYFKLDRRVLIVTDSGVPKAYAGAIAKQCRDARIISFKCGEESKSIGTFASICRAMLDFGLQRKDAVIAVGGGVVGDITGFAASSYMRGIDFYNVPTTLLSQVDSSIGGKTAIDFGGVKNILGAFYQPRAVLIDTRVLDTLDKRQLACGKAEIIKMAICKDAELFERIERQGINEENIGEIILGALRIKQAVVEADEREGGIRKLLNFGHTLGHGIEATTELLHGECVALGMIPMCCKELRPRLISVLKAAELPYTLPEEPDSAFEFMKHDKKGDGGSVDAVMLKGLADAQIIKIPLSELVKIIKEAL